MKEKNQQFIAHFLEVISFILSIFLFQKSLSKHFFH